MNGTIFEVVIVGAGPSGLMCSYYLKHLGLEHIIFEQGRMGESWRSQRWDSFRMITPFRSSVLPGSLLKARKPDAHGSAADMVALLQEYVSAFQLPITEQARVLSVKKSPGSPVFQVLVRHDNELERTYDAWQVIVATGSNNRPLIPPVANALPAEIEQLHVSQYRSADRLKPGGVLVVGGGQSGLEIAYELIQQGRQVSIAARPHPELPQVYRGKEIFQWHAETRCLDHAGPVHPVIVYPLDDEVSLSLASLKAMGARILGELSHEMDGVVTFLPWTAEDCEQAKNSSQAVLRCIDDYCAVKKSTKRSDDAAEEEDMPIENTATPGKHGEAAPESIDVAGATLDLVREQIGTVIWATGFIDSFETIETPLTRGELVANQRGVTAMEGLYVVGSQAAGSDYVAGAKDDASYVTNRIYGVLR